MRPPFDTLPQWLSSRWLKESQQTPCLMRMLGYRCRLYGRRYSCCIGHVPHEDHARIYNKLGHPALYVSEPYGINPEDLKKINAMCLALGLCITFDAMPSPHSFANGKENEGITTIAITLLNADSEERWGY